MCNKEMKTISKNQQKLTIKVILRLMMDGEGQGKGTNSPIFENGQSDAVPRASHVVHRVGSFQETEDTLKERRV